jgi:hypothetical protein
VVTALFNIFTNLIATIIITAAYQVIHVFFHTVIIEYKRFGYAYNKAVQPLPNILMNPHP